MVDNVRMVTEVPSSLKQLARLVVRGFYTLEDAFIVDMLVRNPCMKEGDLCELLKFERKMLRARISTLSNDKFIQVRLRMETGLDGKAQRVNYYFINYKTFVNVVKYKLDIMLKRLETEERDATSRASFKCPECFKTFTDLEADQLFDFMTAEFRCTFCREIVEEDLSALPKKDSRLQLAKFNDQLEPFYSLLHELEGIKLSPEILEPEPVDINTIRGLNQKNRPIGIPGIFWSGDMTRGHGFRIDDTTINVTIGEETDLKTKVIKKETPIWIRQTTIPNGASPAIFELPIITTKIEKPQQKCVINHKNSENIMSFLIANEKNCKNNMKLNIPGHESDASDSNSETGTNGSGLPCGYGLEVGVMESDDEELMPPVNVGINSFPINEINESHISQMTSEEKDTYIQVYQEYYSHMYE